jgi:uncharacterized oxidoreductase
VIKILPDRLKRLVSAIFAAAGSGPHEHERLGHYLVESNLAGHDSHGVIRVPTYVRWVKEGKVQANQTLQVVFENDCLAIVDGQFGFGQVMGEGAVNLGIEKSNQHGVSVVALRNCGHLGRIGDWAELAARAGKISMHFVNTSGAGILVAPFGGITRRLSANPIAMGVPVTGAAPIILDISTCAIAEGKIRVAFNKGVDVPKGCIIDPQGEPTTDPKVFYGDPPGAILPFGGHKGYALGVMAELLAGALTGNGCTKPGVNRLSNGLLSILIDPTFFQPADELQTEIRQFVEFVKTSQPVTAGGEILMPGDVEERCRQSRRAGVELDDMTWSQIVETAGSVGLSKERVEELVGGE